MSSSGIARLDGNKNPTNLHIWQWKTVFLHALHVHFSPFDILKTLSFFLWREWPVLQLCGRREHMMTNVQFCLPEGRFQFNPWIVEAHFSGIITLNNCKMIAETRSDIFRWCYRFRRRRVCLSSLLIMPYARPTGPGFTWQTMTHHRRSALYGARIMEAYFLLIFNTHISFQSCNRCSTIDIRRSPRHHFFEIAIYMLLKRHSDCSSPSFAAVQQTSFKKRKRTNTETQRAWLVWVF